MSENSKIIDLAKKIEDKIINARRYLHMYPELSFKEEGTMKFICNYLDEIGVEYVSEVAGTGVVALIKGGIAVDNPKTLLIRADMDALPVTEKSDKAYKSKNDGVMHACGHDGHTSILLGACEVLNELKDTFSGNIKFVFQPGEETDGGAKPMIDSGVMDNPRVDNCIALHIEPMLQCGKIQIKSGPFYACPDAFSLEIIGKGGHGSEPQNCINPITISSYVINELSKLNNDTKKLDEKVVVSVCSIHSGYTSNVIPSNLKLLGTVRSYSQEKRSFIEREIEKIAKNICNQFGAKYNYEYEWSYPPLVNDEKISEQFYETAKTVLGEEGCIFGGEPTMTGEDFAYFAQEVPSALFKLGCGNKDKNIIYPLHHDSFDMDEDCLVIGVELFASFALRFLS